MEGRSAHGFVKNRLSGAVPVAAPRIGVGEAVGLAAASFVLARNKSDRLHFQLRVPLCAVRPAQLTCPGSWARARGPPLDRLLPHHARLSGSLACHPGGMSMIAWILSFAAGPALLAGLAVYLCRGPRRHQRLTSEQIAQLQALADVEMREDLLLCGTGAGQASAPPTGI